MAVVSLLLSFIGKKIGSIIQAIFGWSVTALFGRLPGKRQLAVTIALLLSIAWPVFVVGLVFPGVAGWLLAFVPLKQWVAPGVLRLIWAALAVITPPIVGLLTHYAAPATRGSAARALFYGYPLALGYFAAFMITVVTVPIVKVVSILKGWTDTHVYVQAREGREAVVVREIGEACARAGFLPEIAEAPARMTLATRVLKTLARGMVRPIVSEKVTVIRAEGLEMYLYPADLLIRGEDTHVARVRAMLLRTSLDADAFLVGSAKGQQLQAELGRLANIIRERHHAGETVGRLATSRLLDIWAEMNKACLPFEEWVLLESIARRVERTLVAQEPNVVFALDRAEDELPKVARRANQAARRAAAPPLSVRPSSA